MTVINKPISNLNKKEFDEAYEELINKYPKIKMNKTEIIETALFFKQITKEKGEELLNGK